MTIAIVVDSNRLAYGDNKLLFAARTTNGTSPSSAILKAGSYNFTVTGTFDGASVALFTQPVGQPTSALLTDELNATNATITSAGTNNVLMAAGTSVSAVITDAGDATSLTVTLNYVGN